MAVCGVALVVCAFARSSAAEPTDSGIVLLYSFDSRSGNVLRDLSGHGNHGTVHGATWAEGKFGHALAFDGLDDYVEAVGYYPFADANGLTVEAWVQLTRRHEFNDIVASRNCCIFRMLISPGLHPYYDAGTYVDVEVTPYRFELGKWTHYALVIVGGQAARVLINGEVVWVSPNGVPERLPNMYEALLIGGIPNSNLFTEGLIDELRLYKKALTDDEIRVDMTSSATGLVILDAEKQLSRLREKGANAGGVQEKLRESRSARDRADDESAQDLAYQAAALARAELKKYGSRGADHDAGKVLFFILTAVFLFGTLTAGALIWGAWKGEGD